MVKAEWGLKRICLHCGTRYYDMKKNPPVCPSCGTVFDPEVMMKSRRSRSSSEDKKKAAPNPDMIDDLPIVDADDADDTLIEDADELGEDDLDVEDVVEVEQEDDDSL